FSLALFLPLKKGNMPAYLPPPLSLFSPPHLAPSPDLKQHRAGLIALWSDNRTTRLPECFFWRSQEIFRKKDPLPFLHHCRSPQFF
ncbi:MAG: hypothetical protein KKG98_07665, partial [Proteobacteria bacterium]|nr:hypothetical protein [Pseudomonadota bacterium]